MKVEKYAELEIAKGRKHQDVFNEIVAGSDFNLHHIAEILRKTVSPEKKARYKSTNYILAGIFFVMTLLNVYAHLGSMSKENVFNWIFIVGDALILYGILNYWKNIYRICLLLLWINFVWLLFTLIFNFDWSLVVLLFFLIDSLIITLYLNIKTCTDYKLNRELLKENPKERINAVIFNED